jgi:hypothetical protein
LFLYHSNIRLYTSLLISITSTENYRKMTDCNLHDQTVLYVQFHLFCSTRESQYRIMYRLKYNILVGGPEGRRPLGKPRHRWEDNIKMDLREIGFGDVDWIHWALLGSE